MFQPPAADNHFQLLAPNLATPADHSPTDLSCVQCSPLDWGDTPQTPRNRPLQLLRINISPPAFSLRN